MAQPPKDHLSNLDRHVQLLEGKVNKLRASLTHWQQWFLDYSALKEEVEQLPTDPPPHEQLRRIRRDFDGKLLTQKEIHEIMGKDDLRTTEQIVNTLSRRLDYVEQNIGTLTKLLEKEENRLAAASVVQQPELGTDEETGLPFTDIIEELDENDNVVNFRLQTGADAEPKIIDALKKAGIEEKDLAATEADLSKSVERIDLDDDDDDDDAKKGEAKDESAPNPAQSVTDAAQQSSPASTEPTGRKKSVSFAEDTKAGHEPDEPKPAEPTAARSRAAQKIEQLMQKAKEQEAIDLSDAVIPENESPEDSKLRREMLEYGMSEIGPVVAELQLEEGTSDNDDDVLIGSEDDFESEVTEDDDDDSEDELGRSKRSPLTPDYIKRMQELEKRLNSQSAFAVGASETKPKKPDEGIGRIAVVDDSKAAGAAAKTEAAPKAKKSVSFAPKLDIAPDTTPRSTPEARPRERKTVQVGDVVEKTTPEETLKDPDEPPKRVSRFKKERAAATSRSRDGLPPGPQHLPANFGTVAPSVPDEPHPPEDMTLAPTVVERPTVSNPTEPDELDDALLYQAAAVEYNRLRNQLIQKQGGVMQQNGAIDSETGQVPLDEELGGPKRMSKFKAARLAKLQ